MPSLNFTFLECQKGYSRPPGLWQTTEKASINYSYFPLLTPAGTPPNLHHDILTMSANTAERQGQTLAVLLTPTASPPLKSAFNKTAHYSSFVLKVRRKCVGKYSFREFLPKVLNNLLTLLFTRHFASALQTYNLMT